VIYLNKAATQACVLPYTNQCHIKDTTRMLFRDNESQLYIVCYIVNIHILQHQFQTNFTIIRLILLKISAYWKKHNHRQQGMGFSNMWFIWIRLKHRLAFSLIQINVILKTLHVCCFILQSIFIWHFFQ
jgi:hypothetical protein